MLCIFNEINLRTSLDLGSSDIVSFTSLVRRGINPPSALSCRFLSYTAY